MERLKFRLLPILEARQLSHTTRPQSVFQSIFTATPGVGITMSNQPKQENSAGLLLLVEQVTHPSFPHSSYCLERLSRVET